MGATFGTKLFTRFHGVKVGQDSFGNVYYREKKPSNGVRERRWVIYGGEAEGSAVPLKLPFHQSATAHRSPAVASASIAVPSFAGMMSAR